MTAPKRIAPALIQQFQTAGLHVTELSLSGRFHWSKHQEDAEKVIDFCNQDSRFQFPDASKLVFFRRLGTESRDISGDRLHEVALREILLYPSKWVQTFSGLYSSHLTADESKVVCFGPERCVPPTIARKLGSRVIHASDINLSSSDLPGTLLGK